MPRFSAVIMWRFTTVADFTLRSFICCSLRYWWIISHLPYFVCHLLYTWGTNLCTPVAPLLPLLRIILATGLSFFNVRNSCTRSSHTCTPYPKLAWNNLISYIAKAARTRWQSNHVFSLSILKKLIACSYPIRFHTNGGHPHVPFTHEQVFLTFTAQDQWQYLDWLACCQPLEFISMARRPVQFMEM